MSPFSDDLLRAVMASAPDLADRSQFWDIDEIGCRAGVKDMAREFGYDGGGFVLTIAARFSSKHGLIASHEWLIRAETLETAWRLLKLGMYASRTGWVDDTVRRKYWVDGHSSMIVTGEHA